MSVCSRLAPHAPHSTLADIIGVKTEALVLGFYGIFIVFGANALG